MKKTLLRSVLLMLLILSLAGLTAVGVQAAGASSYGPESGVKDVCVFLPYDGTTRNNFSALEHVGETVAAYTGGELLCYKGTEATIDRLAAAVEKCAVVIIGSHGNSGTFGLTTDNGADMPRTTVNARRKKMGTMFSIITSGRWTARRSPIT